MQLREDEQILKIYHHHPTPFIYDVLKTIAVFLPLFLILFWFQEVFSAQVLIITNILFFVIFSLVIAYISLIYWLDKLFVTNQRIVFVDWKLLTKKEEAEVFLHEIQDIKTQKKGILSYFRFFDYGYIEIETASSGVTINFVDAPDPEEIRMFIYHVRHQ